MELVTEYRRINDPMHIMFCDFLKEPYITPIHREVKVKNLEMRNDFKRKIDQLQENLILQRGRQAYKPNRTGLIINPGLDLSPFTEPDPVSEWYSNAIRSCARSLDKTLFESLANRLHHGGGDVDGDVPSLYDATSF